MKKEIVKVEYVCDWCGETSYNFCPICKKDYCFKCMQKISTEFKENLNWGNTFNICNDCIETNPNHELVVWAEDIKNRLNDWELRQKRMNDIAKTSVEKSQELLNKWRVR